MWVRDPSWTPVSSMAAPAWHWSWDEELARADCPGTAWGCSSLGGSLVTCTRGLHLCFLMAEGYEKTGELWLVAQKVTWLEDSPSPVLLPKECKQPEGTDLIPSHTS